MIGLPIIYCMGYAKGGNIVRFGSEESTIWGGGAGGSSMVIDTKAHVCLSYVMNQMSDDVLGDQRSNSLGLARYDGL